MRRALLALTVLTAPTTAGAQGLPWPGPGTPASGGASYSGPGDVTAFSAWWSCTRAYSAAKATAQANACDLVRASDSTTCTMKLGTNGNVDLTVGTPCTSGTQTVTQFCNGTTCKVSKAYDQTAGNNCASASCDLVQATDGNRPVFNLSGGANNKPYISATAAGQTLASANNNTGTSLVSMTMVAQRASGSGFPGILYTNGANDYIRYGGSANQWQAFGGNAGFINATANDAAWHAGQVIFNGASSLVNIDGTETTGSITSSGTSGTPQISIGSASTTVYVHEAGFARSTAWTSGSTGTTSALVCKNQAAYYGTTAGTVCS